MLPALPKEAPSPTPPASINVTLKPSRCSHRVEATPTMPAPITVMRGSLTLLGLDVAFLHELRPFLALGANELRALRGRLQRVRLEAECDHLLPQAVAGHDFADRRIQPSDHVGWSARRRLNRLPGRDFESGNAGLGDRRNV